MKGICLLLLLVAVTYARKNVLFLVSDDMRPTLGAYYGADMPSPVHPKMHTPSIDALASKSLLLKRAYVSQALCCPSRTATLTGRRPDTSHIWMNGYYFRQYGGNFTTIPGYFKENGYRTIGMGKIFHPGNASGDDDPVSWTDPYYHAPDDYHTFDHVWEAVSEERSNKLPLQDTLLADAAIQVLQNVAPKAKSGEQPFFLAVGFRKPHLPWHFPARFMDYYPLESLQPPPNYYAPVGMPGIAWFNFSEIYERYDDVKNMRLKNIGHINFTFPPTLTLEFRRAYYSCISFADYELGRVVQELDDLGLSDNTIISFFGDHGWQIGEHGEWGKYTNFEDGTHAPMMIHVPGVTDQGIVTEQLTEYVDLYPTLVELAGLPQLDMCPENSQNVTHCTEGKSLVPLMSDPNTTNWKTAAFSQYPRHGDGITGDIVMGYTMKTDKYRYTEWINFKGKPIYKPMWDELQGAELYDHNTDPQENRNRAYDPSYADLRKDMSKKLRVGWRGALPNSVQ